LSAEAHVVFVPGLAHTTIAVDRNPHRRSPAALRAQLHGLSDRHGGARAMTQRTREIPQAYRVHYGLERSPAEELMVKRLIRGQYRSRGVLRDALLLATIDTEIAVHALDADKITGALRVEAGAVADDDGPLAPLFGDPSPPWRPPWARRCPAAAPPRGAASRPAAAALPPGAAGSGLRDAAVTRATRRVTVYAVTAPGIAHLAVEEAIEIAVGAIASA
jgi:hypothetical protein